jgi:hypothetical protein
MIPVDGPEYCDSCIAAHATAATARNESCMMNFFQIMMSRGSAAMPAPGHTNSASESAQVSPADRSAIAVFPFAGKDGFQQVNQPQDLLNGPDELINWSFTET